MHITQKNDAEFCGKVPLHQTNQVQPHGYLLIIDRDSLQILQASENVTALLGVSGKEAVQTLMNKYLPQNQLEQIKESFKNGVQSRLPFLLDFNTGSRLSTVKAQANYFVMEVEREDIVDNKQKSFLSVYQDIKYVMAAIEQGTDIRELCQQVIAALKRLSGFDKIMIYQFDEYWNGDVIAEVMEDGMDSYLGLKFPASDVPQQARELYKKTPYRLIPNVNYTPVKLYPVLNPKTRMFTDLSDSNLRSVAEVHLEYLRNMKVAASMSTRILKDNQLWGLIACHHREPKYLSYEMCSVFELLSHTLSAKISSIQNKDVFDNRSGMYKIHAEIIEHIFRNNSLSNLPPDLLNLLKADGVAVCMNGMIERIGQTPEENEIHELINWLQAIENQKVYMQSSLSSVFEPADAYSEISSGIMALPLQPEKQNFILAFRAEAVKKILWGGKPHEAVQFEPDGKGYHPRASFAAWQETVKKTSLPWTNEEIEVAEKFRNSVSDFILNKMES